MAVILRHFEGASYKEIAHIMKKPEGTIKTYIYKGRQMMIEKLKYEDILEDLIDEIPEDDTCHWFSSPR